MIGFCRTFALGRIFGIPIGLARSECAGSHLYSHPCHQAGGTGGILFPRPCAPHFVPSGLPGWVGVWRSFRPCSSQVLLFGPSCLSSTRRWACCGAASRLLALRRELGSSCFVLCAIAYDRISGSAIGLVFCEGVCSSPAKATAIRCPCFHRLPPGKTPRHRPETGNEAGLGLRPAIPPAGCVAVKTPGRL